jgi:signal transduction histidine kinase/CheY-like chemotaxis protein
MAINRVCARDLERLYGIRAHVGDDLLAALDGHPDERARVHAFWSRALAGEEFTAADEFGDADLERRYYEMKFNALRDRDGKLLGAFQFVYDITDRLKDQARLAEAERTLRQAQKIDAIGQLTGGVAHDFNNLLMVISGGLSLLQRHPDGERRHRIVEQMRQAADRGASLVRQLLTFARTQPLNPTPVDLRRQIDGMRELLDRTLRGDVQVNTDLAADLWPIKVDAAELELVVLNLCVNARDAMPRGGVITIGARNSAHTADRDPSEDRVVLTVTDTGIGMAAEVLAHIFEPFFTTKEIGKGSGLGLPQVYGFAQRSGGRVQVDSAVGRGTTITLSLPRSHESPAPALASPPEPALPLRPAAALGSILIVEDDDEVAALVTEMVRGLGYRSTRVSSAQAALGALADGREIDLVFTDVMMPGAMNGIDLAREIHRRRPSLPVLLTSGFAEKVLQSAAGESFRVLSKPYEVAELERALRAALES